MDLNSHVSRYTVKHSNKIRRIYQDIGDHFDINYFTYHTLSWDGQYSVIVSNPELAEFYSANKLYMEDPFLKHPRSFSEGAVFWSSVVQPDEKEMLELIQGKFDMAHGFGLIQKARNPNYVYEFFGFTAPPRNHSVTNIFVNEMDLFRKFCDHFREEAGSVLKHMHDNPVNIGDLKKEKFFYALPMVTRLKESERSKIDLTLLAAKSPSSNRSQLFATLSVRERQCLNLYLKGNSATKTGEILGLSFRTVEHYIESIKNKVNCERKSDLFRVFGSSK